MAQQTQRSSFSDELADELAKLEHSTNGDHVEVEIGDVKDCDRGNREVAVEFKPPLGEPFDRSMSVSPDPNYPGNSTGCSKNSVTTTTPLPT